MQIVISVWARTAQRAGAQTQDHLLAICCRHPWSARPIRFSFDVFASSSCLAEDPGFHDVFVYHVSCIMASVHCLRLQLQEKNIFSVPIHCTLHLHDCGVMYYAILALLESQIAPWYFLQLTLNHWIWWIKIKITTDPRMVLARHRPKLHWLGGTSPIMVTRALISFVGGEYGQA